MGDQVPIIHRTSWSRIDKEATSILDVLQPRALSGEEAVSIDSIFEFDLPDIMLERYGISLRTGVTDLSKYGHGEILLGITDAKAGLCLIDKSVYETTDPVQLRRGRATMAHEMYHCLCHVPRARTFTSRSNSSFVDAFPRCQKNQLKAYEDPEKQAWKFAQMLMMPKPAILKFLQEGRSEQWMADFFDVNPAFLRARLGCNTLK